jgi:mono/diheme cytochrome c family protein
MSPIPHAGRKTLPASPAVLRLTFLLAFVIFLAIGWPALADLAPALPAPPAGSYRLPRPPMERPLNTLVTGLSLALLGDGAAGQTTGPRTPPLIIQSMAGQDLFNFYCASCHGRDGKGRGPVLPALSIQPPDLTTLTARYGGTFPRTLIESFVAGNRVPVVPAHGSKDMPVWGPIFMALDPNSTANRVRIESIVDYIESLQRTP